MWTLDGFACQRFGPGLPAARAFDRIVFHFASLWGYFYLPCLVAMRTGDGLFYCFFGC
jgi:hypothetical protein